MNGLAKITVDGREVVLKFGLPAIRRIMEKMLQYQLMDGKGEHQTYNDLGITHVLFAGYLNGCMMRDEIPDLSFESFYNLTESAIESETDKAQIVSAIRIFEESKFVKQSVEKAKEKAGEEKKSPSIGMKSKRSRPAN